MPRHIGTTQGEYSVVQTFVSGEQEYVRAWVSAEEAMEAFRHYTNNVSVRLGFTTRVIITDGGDCTAAVWTPETGPIVIGVNDTPEILASLDQN